MVLEFLFILEAVPSMKGPLDIPGKSRQTIHKQLKRFEFMSVPPHRAKHFVNLYFLKHFASPKTKALFNSLRVSDLFSDKDINWEIERKKAKDQLGDYLNGKKNVKLAKKKLLAEIEASLEEMQEFSNAVWRHGFVAENFHSTEWAAISTPIKFAALANITKLEVFKEQLSKL